MSNTRQPIAALFSLLLLVSGAACGDDNATAVHPAVALTDEAGAHLDALSFGAVPVATEAEEVFVIRSNGRAPLHVEEIGFSSTEGEPSGAFSVSPAPPFHIEPLGSQQVRVRFRPEEVRHFAETVVVRSNDPERPEARLPLVGEGVAGRLEVLVCLPDTAQEPGRCAATKVNAPDPLDMGQVTAGSHAEALVTLFNGGGDELRVSRVAFVDPEAAAEAGFSMQEGSGATTIPSLGSADFTVDFDPPAGSEGAAATRLVVESDSRTDPEVEVELQATVGPNHPPLACLFVREVRRADGTTEELEPGDPLPAVEPTDRVIFDARAEEGCSGDPEDGDDVTLEFTLSAPRETSRLETVSGEPFARSLEAEATGTYRVELLVRDSLGLEATAEAIELEVSLQRDIAVEIAWEDAPLVDIDLHFVREASDYLWNDLHDTYWQNPSPEWGEAGPFDDPLLILDDLGNGALVETVVLDDPEAGQDYWVIARFNRDTRDRAGAQSCATDAACTGGLVCAGDRCMPPVEVGLKVFLRDQEQELTGLPGFANPFALHGPCDAWLAGRVAWPSQSSGTPTFEPAGALFVDGTPQGAVCDRQ